MPKPKISLLHTENTVTIQVNGINTMTVLLNDPERVAVALDVFNTTIDKNERVFFAWTNNVFDKDGKSIHVSDRYEIVFE